MKNKFTAMLIGLSGIFFFNCQNDLSPAGDETGSVTVEPRYIPSNAIGISPTNGVLTLEGGKNYVMYGNDTISSIVCSSSTSNNTGLYIAGTLTFRGVRSISFPDGLLTTVITGGTVNEAGGFYTLRLGRECPIYVEKGAKMLLQDTDVSYPIGSTGSTVINYGILELYSLLLRDCYFYNMTDARATICNFLAEDRSKVTNYSTFVSCEGEPYNY